MKEIIVATMREVIEFLNKNRTFFEEDSKARRKAMEADGVLPFEIQNYLATVDVGTLIADLRLVVMAINGGIDKMKRLEGGFFEAMAGFFCGSFAERVDGGLDEVKDGMGFAGGLGRAIAEFVEVNSAEQIAIEVESLISKVKKVDFVMVQSPLRLEPERRKEIRLALREEYPNAFTWFTVNKKVIGGLRVFANGQTTDLSWLSKINHLTTLTKL